MGKLIAAVSAVVLFILVGIGVFVGWWMNIVDLATSTSFGPLELVRAFGIVLFPLGAVMGWAY